VNVRNFSLVLAIVAMSLSSVNAQGDFFFSFTDGGTNADQSMDFSVGDTGSLYIYWSTNGPADSDLSVGAFIDVLSDTAGVISFTAAETFDFDITVGGTDIGNRNLDDMGGGGAVGPPNQPITPDLVDELFAFTVTGGPGILEANNGSGAFLDSGYNANNDGFLWGRVDFDVIGEGTTNITGRSGDGLIVNGAEEVPAIFTTVVDRLFRNRQQLVCWPLVWLAS